MKFLVDTLPYYEGFCPFCECVKVLTCLCSETPDCPRHWDKEYVCSDDNPHECEMLKEIKNF